MAFDFDVKVFKIPNSASKTVAFANLVIDNEVEVCGFKIIKGANGLFVAPPNRKSTKNDEQGNPIYYDDVRFVGTRPEEAKRTEIQEQVYKLMIDKYSEQTSTSARGSAATAQAARNTSPPPGLW